MPSYRSSDAGQDFSPTEAAPLDALDSAQADTEASPLAPDIEPQSLRKPKGAVATFMYARVHNFSAVCQGMTTEELTSFLNEVRRILSAAALELGGEIAHRRPDSILCVFAHNPQDRVPTDAKRALHAAILTVHECVNLAARVAARARTADAPALSMAIGLHLGVADVVPRAVNKNTATVHATGEAVEIARLLEVVAADMHWGVVASISARQAGGTRVDSGHSGTLGLPDDSFLEVVEIAGLVPRKGSTTPLSHYEMLRESLRQNQRLLNNGAQSAGHMVIEDYRLLRKIGEGGNATIFLAQPIAGGVTQVLKVLRPDNGDQVMGLQRFIQEFALAANIKHPNVASIFRQGFSGDTAYIAMEYFPVGDLRSRMTKPMDPGVAVYYLRQIAAGLDALHQVGIVHRDLKPDNVMMRQDGIVAIADFGVAKQVSMHITDTGAGESVGTPYYLSPEQAQGMAVDARSDIYSLGVLTYEMLTGERPYHANTAQDLLQMHVSAPVPTLPPALQRLQPVLDKMMAKNPAERFATATALLDALGSVGA